MAHRLAAALQTGDIGALAALYAEDAVMHHPLSPDPVRGRDAIREGEQELLDAFSSIEVDVRSVVSDGSRCVAEVVLRATNTGPLDLGGPAPAGPTGRRIELPSVWWFDIGGDGLVVEERDYFDGAALMAQLGLGG